MEALVSNVSVIQPKSPSLIVFKIFISGKMHCMTLKGQRSHYQMRALARDVCISLYPRWVCMYPGGILFLTGLKMSVASETLICHIYSLPCSSVLGLNFLKLGMYNTLCMANMSALFHVCPFSYFWGGEGPLAICLFPRQKVP